ncbi:MAG: glycoside hydrolase family 26 protein [Maribacter sp.]|nr:glycoside hydrolase family 26 protein [Maribacter sp.]
MKLKKGLLLLLFLSNSLIGQDPKPVTPKASPEAVALLQLLYSIRGNHILSGQHNFPVSRARNSEFASDYIGKTPTVWSQDFGFSVADDKDSYLSRPAIVEEAIQQYKKGAIITLCWHAVPPTADEPITFQPVPGYDSTALASVQGKLLEKQFEDVLTKGTPIYKKWIAQVDEIAKYLKQLQDAHVPVLWRPYHEMNGDWFWWGGRYAGKFTTERLYRQLFDRFVKHHKLRNLVWMWSVDRPSKAGREFEYYYPGNDYLDVVSLDVYGSDFNAEYYTDLKSLAKGKPLALGEVGVPPTLEVFESQPDWTFYVIWSGMARGTPKKQYDSYLNSDRVLFLEDLAYQKISNPLRVASNLPELYFKTDLDFSGLWVLNESESELRMNGPASTPYKMNIIQFDDALAIATYALVEWGDDEVNKQLLKTDGTDNETVVFNAPRIQHASWSDSRDKLTVTSLVKFNFAGHTVERKGIDIWKSSQKGKKLIIEKTADTFQGGTVNSTLVYDRQ